MKDTDRHRGRERGEAKQLYKRRSCLPRVAELAAQSARDGGVDVSVVKHNERRIAAQL